jgi:hypothetical protein
MRWDALIASGGGVLDLATAGRLRHDCGDSNVLVLNAGSPTVKYPFAIAEHVAILVFERVG